MIGQCSIIICEELHSLSSRHWEAPNPKQSLWNNLSAGEFYNESQHNSSITNLKSGRIDIHWKVAEDTSKYTSISDWGSEWEGVSCVYLQPMRTYQNIQNIIICTACDISKPCKVYIIWLCDIYDSNDRYLLAELANMAKLRAVHDK